MQPDLSLLTLLLRLARRRVVARALQVVSGGERAAALTRAGLQRLRAAGLADEHRGRWRLTLPGLAIAVALSTPKPRRATPRPFRHAA